MSLLNTTTGFTTPWHCSVALTADGEWLSGPMSDFKKNPMLEIVYEDGRPSYFREKTRGPGEHTDAEKTASNKQVLKPLNGLSVGLVSGKEVAAEMFVEIPEEKLQIQSWRSLFLIVGSVFYNLPNDTSTLYTRGALLFFAILLAAFAEALKVRSSVTTNVV